MSASGAACSMFPFPDRRAASDALLGCQIKRVLYGLQRRQERRYYECRCGAWHLTKQDKHKGDETL
ncbi:hypothetical protein [Actinokineospora globicatena]|uniref:Uncharacterized protein n=1 Tax=Actinokineospora globicatena TaxID=103729 RepID=A0A9W6QLH5_9PSEU|nr:hypothetical protein [Actinokineospora globicatena]GLW91815.1 hypothetical protein Aglo03_26310 [Actinokineospora globicatena]